jgi:iron complex transport system substrate-binding protein
MKRPHHVVLRLAIAIAAMLGVIPAACAADHPSIASINVCTDQLLLTLADPEQIVGVSPFSGETERSWAAEQASRFRRLSGEAEDLLMLKPDIVVATRFMKRATRELLRGKGQRLVEFDFATSIDDVKAEIRQMGDIVGHPDRAAAQVTRIDEALARAKAAASRKHYRVLAIERRGWVTGEVSLTSSLLAATGLTNAASDMGLKAGGFASLETVISLKPDLLLVTSSSAFAEDQGEALLLHPALERLYPLQRRLVLPERLTVCGGPMLADAIDRLTAEIERVSR